MGSGERSKTILGRRRTDGGREVSIVGDWTSPVVGVGQAEEPHVGCLEVSNVEHRFQVEGASGLGCCKVVDQDGCSSPASSAVLDETLKCHELATGVNQIVNGEHPVG